MPLTVFLESYSILFVLFCALLPSEDREADTVVYDSEQATGKLYPVIFAQNI